MEGIGCKVGDIIVVEKYSSHGVDLSRHSFVILSNDSGEIRGLSYDVICNVMSSFKNEEQRKEKMSYPGNFPIVAEDCDIADGNTKNGYIKADQLYYFSLESLNT